jgi:hypothetical protein
MGNETGETQTRPPFRLGQCARHLKHVKTLHYADDVRREFLGHGPRLPRQPTKLPKDHHEAPEWRAAMEALILVATLGEPTMFARIGVMRALSACVSCVEAPGSPLLRRPITPLGDRPRYSGNVLCGGLFHWHCPWGNLGDRREPSSALAAANRRPRLPPPPLGRSIA